MDTLSRLSHDTDSEVAMVRAKFFLKIFYVYINFVEIQHHNS